MAKDAKPEGDAGTEEGAAPKKSKKKLIIIIAAAVVLLGGGAGAFFMMSGKKDASHGEAKEGEHAEGSAEGEHAEGEAKPAGPSVYFDLPQFLVNLNTGGKQTSFLKMTVTLEVEKKRHIKVIEANMPKIMDSLNTYLRELRASDLYGSAGVYRLREEILGRVNKELLTAKPVSASSAKAEGGGHGEKKEDKEEPEEGAEEEKDTGPVQVKQVLFKEIIVQ